METTLYIFFVIVNVCMYYSSLYHAVTADGYKKNKHINNQNNHTVTCVNSAQNIYAHSSVVA